jgi:hypothetical protein
MHGIQPPLAPPIKGGECKFSLQLVPRNANPAPRSPEPCL